MRRYRSQLASSPAAEPVNVTPLIDVVMCLIVFFLIVGKLAANEKARVQLPATAIGSVAQRQDAVVVTVARDLNAPPDKPASIIAIDGQTAADGADLLRLLTDRLQRRAKAAAMERGLPTDQAEPLSRGKVIVRADKDLSYQAVEPVLSACAQLGITKVDYATARGSEEAK